MERARSCRRRREVILSHIGLAPCYTHELRRLQLAETAGGPPLANEEGLTSVRYGAEKVRYEVDVDARGFGVAIITIDNPPVNSLNYSILHHSLPNYFAQALGDDDVHMVVVRGANGRFVAGAEISDIQGSLSGSTPHEVVVEETLANLQNDHAWIGKVENSNKPVIAAIDVFALGGGLELAMGCHARVCTRNTSLGLPELALGILPGFGGTQRLPRLVGVKKAVEMMLTSRPIKADEAKKLGLVDEVVASSQELHEAAVRLGKRILAGELPLRRSLKLEDKLGAIQESRAIIDAAYQQQSKAFPRNAVVHPFACLDAILAGLQTGGESGLLAEAQAFARCMTQGRSPARAMTHAFFAERRTAQIPGVTDRDLRPKEIKLVGVIGGGLMGSGIATALLLSGIRVVLKEVDQKFLDNGVATIKGNLDRALEKGRLTKEIHAKMVAGIVPTLTLEPFRQVDLVIEAVVENLKVKQGIFAELEKICKPDCILASNTSTIPINEIAALTKAHNRVLGLHFFSPAQVMPLVEIVHTRQTSAQVLVDCLGLVKRLQKTPIVVGNCPGFTVNRIFFPYFQAAAFLVDIGENPYRIDKVLMNFGMPMGVHRLGDLVGIDVGTFVNGNFEAAFPDRVYRSKLNALLVEQKRYGQKTGKGWYSYEKGKLAEDPALQPILEQSRTAAGLSKGRNFTDEEIAELILFPVVNESCRVVEEGMVVRPSDVDVGSLYGYSFPRFRGGILNWADSIQGGPGYIAKRLAAWQEEFAPILKSNFFAPSRLLLQHAQRNIPLSLPLPEEARPLADPRDVVIVSTARTPIGRAKRGMLKDTEADDLLATVLQKLQEDMRSHGMSPDAVGDIIVGSIGATVAHLRIAAFLGGFPDSVPVKKVDRLCSSGLQAIADAYLAISTGQVGVCIAGGVESMSTMVRAPTLPNAKAKGDPRLESVYLPMGITSENVASRYNVPRAVQDQVALQRAAEAAKTGKFRDEIVPVKTKVKDKDGKLSDVVLEADEGVRADTTIEGLNKLKPAFKENGTSTAGNSSQVSDGAAAVLLMTRALAESFGWEILGCIRSFAAVGCDPAVMGIGPALAIPKAVEKAGLTVKDIELFEVNEAFASQCYYCVDELGISADRVNVNGGAIALGHPLGCTGARLTGALLHEMRRRRARFGVVSMCVGTGMGAAAVFERC